MNRATKRDLSAGRDLDEDVAARRLWMRLSHQERGLFGVPHALKIVDEEQAKREDK
jgi:hypothetical protein